MLVHALLAAALAQDPESPVDPVADAQARELFQDGSTRYEQGEYEQAIVAWEQAYALSPRPLLLYNIANALERLGRWQDAMRYLTRYRAHAEDEERDVLDRRIKAINARIEEQKAAPRPVAPPAAPAEPGFPILPVALFSAGGLGVVTGAVFGFQALGARANASESCTTVGDATWCTEDASENLAKDRSSALAADVLLGIGAACAIGGALTLVFPVDLALGPGTVAVRGRF